MTWCSSKAKMQARMKNEKWNLNGNRVLTFELHHIYMQKFRRMSLLTDILYIVLLFQTTNIFAFLLGKNITDFEKPQWAQLLVWLGKNISDIALFWFFNQKDTWVWQEHKNFFVITRFYLPAALFRNRKFMLDEMPYRNSSKFAIFLS